MGAERLLDFFSAIEECEALYPVSSWRVSGIPVWPLIRTEGRAELAYKDAGNAPRPSDISRITQLLRDAASPLLHPLENCSDWQHEKLRLRPVDALFLGDGISHDFINNAWRDRYCAPLIDALDATGQSCILMQPRAQKVPRDHDTYSVQWIQSWGRLLARIQKPSNIDLPHYDDVRNLLRERGFVLSVLDLGVMKRWGVKVAAMARLFGGVLDKTQPRIGFVVSYYWDVGFAFVLACRQRRILCVDIQHGSQDGRHEAYNFWSAVPHGGYSVLPDIFWTWSEEDAGAVNVWAERLEQPWHRGVWGGHPQFAVWLDDADPQTRKFDALITSIKKAHEGQFDILVALQDLDGYSAVWDKLADLINSSPSNWRWWLRRHPVPAFNRGAGIKKLLALKRRNVLLDEATSLPMPALLRNVGAVLSLMSSTAVEASFFGHRPIFLTEDARHQFSEIFKADKADVINDMDALMEHLGTMAQNAGPVERPYHRTDLKHTVSRLLSIADQRTETRSNVTNT